MSCCTFKYSTLANDFNFDACRSLFLCASWARRASSISLFLIEMRWRSSLYTRMFSPNSCPFLTSISFTAALCFALATSWASFKA